MYFVLRRLLGIHAAHAVHLCVLVWHGHTDPGCLQPVDGGFWGGGCEGAYVGGRPGWSCLSVREQACSLENLKGNGNLTEAWRREGARRGNHETEAKSDGQRGAQYQTEPALISESPLLAQLPAAEMVPGIWRYMQRPSLVMADRTSFFSSLDAAALRSLSNGRWPRKMVCNVQCADCGLRTGRFAIADARTRGAPRYEVAAALLMAWRGGTGRPDSGERGCKEDRHSAS